MSDEGRPLKSYRIRTTDDGKVVMTLRYSEAEGSVEICLDPLDAKQLAQGLAEAAEYAEAGA